MVDVFYAILVIWILWRIFGGSSSKSRTYHRHTYNQPQNPEGEIKITAKKKKENGSKDDEGEYVDYEEIK